MLISTLTDRGGEFDGTADAAEKGSDLLIWELLNITGISRIGGAAWAGACRRRRCRHHSISTVEVVF